MQSIDFNPSVYFVTSITDNVLRHTRLSTTSKAQISQSLVLHTREDSCKAGAPCLSFTDILGLGSIFRFNQLIDSLSKAMDQYLCSSTLSIENRKHLKIFKGKTNMNSTDNISSLCMLSYSQKLLWSKERKAKTIF